MRQSKAWPHLVWFCPFATSEGSSLLEEAYLPPGAARAASLPVLVLSWSLPYTVPHLLLRGGPCLQMLWCLWSWCASCGSRPQCCLGKPQVAIPFLSPPGTTQKAPREMSVWWIGRVHPSEHVLSACRMLRLENHYGGEGVPVFRKN